MPPRDERADVRRRRPGRAARAVWRALVPGRRRIVRCATWAASAWALAVCSVPPAAAGDPDGAILAGAAKRYADHALGFSCLETWTEVRYSGGAAGRESVTESSYLLLETTAPYGGVVTTADRDVLRRALVGRRPRIDVPEPYAWSALLARVAGPSRDVAATGPPATAVGLGAVRTTPLTLVLPFRSAAPVRDGNSVDQWTGSIEIDRRDGNLVRVEAQPNFQREILEAKRLRYQQATPITLFGLVQFRTVRKPHGVDVEVLFASKANGIHYPTRMTVTRFEPWGDGPDRRTTTSKAVVEYSGYRFFQTGTREALEAPAAGARKRR